MATLQTGSPWAQGCDRATLCHPLHFPSSSMIWWFRSRKSMLTSQSTQLSLSILLYADDIVVLSKSRDDCQKQLDIIPIWYWRWGMAVNTEKSQVMHVRNHQRPRCDCDLYLDHRELQYVSSYKYLGCWINEFLSNMRTVEALTAAAGWSFGRIVNI